MFIMSLDFSKIINSNVYYELRLQQKLTIINNVYYELRFQ